MEGTSSQGAEEEEESQCQEGALHGADACEVVGLLVSLLSEETTTNWAHIYMWAGPRALLHPSCGKSENRRRGGLA